jgi:hypothetical protein
MPLYLAVFPVLIVLLIVTIINNKIFAEPILKDNSLRAELVTQGLHSPTSMAFLDENRILVLEKNSGNVLLVSNGVLQKQPVLKLHVDHTTLTCCRGLLGIAVMSDKSARSQSVFLYYSELLDGKDSVRNRLYRYAWNGASLVNPVLILDLPATPGPNHPAGKIVIGLDVIPVGGQFKACATNLATNAFRCATGTNSLAKTPESVSITVPSGSTGEGRINWLGICRIPVVDALLSEPCETLTTPDGYTLTKEGERVVGCIVGLFGGSAALMIADPSGSALGTAQQLGLSSAVGCKT